MELNTYRVDSFICNTFFRQSCLLQGWMSSCTLSISQTRSQIIWAMNAVTGITLLIASLFIVKTHEMTIQSFYGSLLDPPIDQNSGNDDVWDVPPVTSSGDKDTEDTSGKCYFLVRVPILSTKWHTSICRKRKQFLIANVQSLMNFHEATLGSWSNTDQFIT